MQFCSSTFLVIRDLRISPSSARSLPIAASLASFAMQSFPPHLSSLSSICSSAPLLLFKSWSSHIYFPFFLFSFFPFFLFSFFPFFLSPLLPFSLSPFLLSWQRYSFHVFWQQLTSEAGLHLVLRGPRPALGIAIIKI